MTFNYTAYLEVMNYIKKHATKSVKIVVVSKNHPENSIKTAISYGIKIFGENKVQEAIGKFSSIKDQFPNIELHLTGALQTNKVKQAIGIFDIFQTLDREKLANEFHKHQNLIANKQFFIQVNIGKEDNKSGIMPEEAAHFINYCRFDIQLPIVGLMCIPPQNENPIIFFEKLKQIAINNKLNNLSMGMSNDYQDAVLSGANNIRIGTKFFGQRY